MKQINIRILYINVLQNYRETNLISYILLKEKKKKRKKSNSREVNLNKFPNYFVLQLERRFDLFVLVSTEFINIITAQNKIM